LDFFVKAEISGIQDFIFAVPQNDPENGEISVSKFLKGRSLFVEKLSEVLFHRVKENLGVTPTDELIAGGNFEFHLMNFAENRKEELTSILNKIKQGFLESELPLDFYFGVSLQQEDLEKQLQLSRRKPYLDLPFDKLFEPFECERKNQKDFVGITEDFIKVQNTGYAIQPVTESSKSVFKKFGYEIKLEETKNNEIQLKGIPLWTKDLKDLFGKDDEFPSESTSAEGSIIDFDCLGLFAEKRTGTDCIACLTLDVDNLGATFRGLKKDERSSLSKELKDFFSKGIKEILDKDFDKKENFKTRLKDNIYFVFSGGDDFVCIGSWDAVLELASILNEEFKGKFKNNKLTLSAGLVITGSKFPVARLAPLAIEAEKNAKNKKNHISLFSEVFSWEEFEEITKIKDKILKLIKLTGNRGIIDKVRRSCVGFEKLQDQSSKGRVNLQKVWRLAYFLRDGTDDKDQEVKNSLEKLIEIYEGLILKGMMNQKKMNPMIFPTAARLAEFESRKEEQSDAK
jgi:CRISPR/Cas system-associated protein Cas10 (large subunit of type III CRISPR-Cas system)